MVDRDNQHIKVLRIELGTCAPAVATEGDNRSKATTFRGIIRMLLNHMRKGRSGVDVKDKVGVIAAHAHGWVSGATMLKGMHVK